VEYATEDGIAIAGSDYTAASGSLTIAPGDTTATIDVALIDDPIAEADETFFVNLTNPAGATIADGRGQGTISGDNIGPGGDTPALSISSATATEADGSVTLTVTLSAPSAFTVTVDYATADESALAGLDFAAAAGTLSFAPGETTQTVTVALVDDDLAELD